MDKASEVGSRGFALIAVTLAISIITVFVINGIRQSQNAFEDQRSQAQSYSKNSLGYQIVALLQDMNACKNSFQVFDLFGAAVNAKFDVTQLLDAQEPPQIRYAVGQEQISHHLRISKMTLTVTQKAATVGGQSYGGIANLMVEVERLGGAKAGGVLKPFRTDIDFQLFDNYAASALGLPEGSLRRCRSTTNAVEDKWKSERSPANGLEYTVFGSNAADQVVVGYNQRVVADGLHSHYRTKQAYFKVSGSSNFFDAAQATDDYLANYAVFGLTTAQLWNPSNPSQPYFDGWNFVYKNARPEGNQLPLLNPPTRAYARDFAVAMFDYEDPGGAFPFSFTINHDIHQDNRILKYFQPGNGPPDDVAPKAPLHVHAKNHQGMIFVTGSGQADPPLPLLGLPRGELDFAAGLYLSSDGQSAYDPDQDRSRSDNSWLIAQRLESFARDTEILRVPPLVVTPDNFGALEIGRMQVGQFYSHFHMDDDFGHVAINPGSIPIPSGAPDQFINAALLVKETAAGLASSTATISIAPSPSLPPVPRLLEDSYSSLKLYSNTVGVSLSATPPTPPRKYYELSFQRDLSTADIAARDRTNKRLALHYRDADLNYVPFLFVNEELGTPQSGAISIGFDEAEDTNIAGAPATCRLNVDGTVKLTGHQTIVASDARVKNLLGPYRRGYDDIKQLRPVEFFWRDSSWGQGPQVGAIAQEVLEFIPEAVKLDTRQIYRLDKGPVLWAQTNALKTNYERSQATRNQVANLYQRAKGLRAEVTELLDEVK